jgi:glutathione S-transferase
VLWCCTKLGVSYERVEAGGPFGATDTLEYLGLSPNGLVPTITASDFSR